MKKQLIIYSMIVFSFSSCNTERTTVSNYEALRTPQMENFSKAFRSLGDPQNRPTEEEKKSGSAELSDRRKEILLPAAKELLKAEGYTDEEIRTKTKGNTSDILVWAIQVHQAKTAEINKTLQLTN